ncbi:MAG: Uma2 family endonuclease [Gemmatimonadota bacterium]|nr:Uma2 family endonuclease [Gemmatimonadota bacterium]
MAMPASVPRYWTPADVLAEFPEGSGTRHECIDGELFVTSAKRTAHAIAVQRLARLLSRAIEADDQLPRVIVLLADLRLTADSLVQPDLFVLPAPLSADARWEDLPRPILIIEVLSPSTAHVDRGRKRHLYQRAGVPAYWIVDLDARCVERWTPSSEAADVKTGTLQWVDPVSDATVDIDLAALFASVLDG